MDDADLVARLRRMAAGPRDLLDYGAIRDAADTIEQLTKERDDARTYAVELRLAHKKQTDRLRSLWDADASELVKVKEALALLLGFAQALERRSSKGTGSRRGGVIFAKARAALTPREDK